MGPALLGAGVQGLAAPSHSPARHGHGLAPHTPLSLRTPVAVVIPCPPCHYSNAPSSPPPQFGRSSPGQEAGLLRSHPPCPGALNRRTDPRWFWTRLQLEERAWGVSVKSLDLHPHSSPQSSSEACREGVGRTAGSCRAEAA